MSTKERKIHYGNFFVTICGVNCGYDTGRKALIVENVTCRSCLSIILSRAQRDVEQARQHLDKVLRQVKNAMQKSPKTT